jgi:hypothetical protein
VSHSDGKLVRLESGVWAQYRQIPVLNAAAPMLIAVELTEEEVRRLLPRLEQPSDDAVH